MCKISGFFKFKFYISKEQTGNRGDYYFLENYYQPSLLVFKGSPQHLHSLLFVPTFPHLLPVHTQNNFLFPKSRREYVGNDEENEIST